MNIAVFGDSYAVNNTCLSKKTSWLDYLKSQPDIFHLNSYGVRGSSFYFSYDEFKKYHGMYDNVIVCVTNWPRLYIKLLPNFLKHVPSFEICDHRIKEHPEYSAYFEAVKNYFLYLENDFEKKEYQRLMIEQIKTLRSDALIIPCFDIENSLVPNWDGDSLFDIWNMTVEEITGKHWNNLTVQEQLDLTITDDYHCHMSDNSNRILGELIFNWLKSDRTVPFTFTLDKFKKPAFEKHPIDTSSTLLKTFSNIFL